jgi:choline dehydrogenase
MGTARMGVDPTTSVVDTSLRVHGIKKLRIVDASVFPMPLSGHPTAPVIAVAERAADLIKGL